MLHVPEVTQSDRSRTNPYDGFVRMIATIDADRTIESACESAHIRVNPRWNSKSAFHIDDVRACPQSGRNAAWLAAGDHDVVVLRDRQGIEDRFTRGRLHQGKITPEVVEVSLTAVSGRCIREFHVLAGEVLGQRCGH